MGNFKKGKIQTKVNILDLEPALGNEWDGFQSFVMKFRSMFDARKRKTEDTQNKYNALYTIARRQTILHKTDNEWQANQTKNNDSQRNTWHVSESLQKHMKQVRS